MRTQIENRRNVCLVCPVDGGREIRIWWREGAKNLKDNVQEVNRKEKNTNIRGINQSNIKKSNVKRSRRKRKATRQSGAVYRCGRTQLQLRIHSAE
ncbi:hypothetical protein MIMGU_mgv1a017054mg [Erythranthe guttata]|uniref:Uncharacterized protein n=1 Tax=Erythranthe guttata TaxID=4155 RepID=A0A022RH19_ERYGU|nr:hypothetical protein MIMGU_mgv1a017054mg [Erythranthe guttata]